MAEPLVAEGVLTGCDMGSQKCCLTHKHTGGGVFRPLQEHGCSGLNRNPRVPATQTLPVPSTLDLYKLCGLTQTQTKLKAGRKGNSN